MRYVFLFSYLFLSIGCFNKTIEVPGTPQDQSPNEKEYVFINKPTGSGWFEYLVGGAVGGIAGTVGTFLALKAKNPAPSLGRKGPFLKDNPNFTQLQVPAQADYVSCSWHAITNLYLLEEVYKKQSHILDKLLVQNQFNIAVDEIKLKRGEDYVFPSKQEIIDNIKNYNVKDGETAEDKLQYFKKTMLHIDEVLPKIYQFELDNLITLTYQKGVFELSGVLKPGVKEMEHFVTPKITEEEKGLVGKNLQLHFRLEEEHLVLSCAKEEDYKKAKGEIGDLPLKGLEEKKFEGCEVLKPTILVLIDDLFNDKQLVNGILDAKVKEIFEAQYHAMMNRLVEKQLDDVLLDALKDSKRPMLPIMVNIGSHWVAFLVVQKKGKYHVYYMNSLHNKNILKEDRIREFAEYLVRFVSK